jgi:hypothetical protein
MKRKMFATAVVLVVLATPLFGRQAPAPAKPAPAAAQKPAAKAEPKPATATKAAPAPPKVTSVTMTGGPQKPATAPAKPAATAATKAAPAPAPAAKAVPTPVVKAGPVAPSAVQEKLRANKDLVADVQAKLAGTDAVTAAGGFKDLPEFVSAVYAAHNLGLSFDALKTKMLNGKRTGLRQAIQELRPAASAAIEAQRAQYDAVGTIRTTERAATEAAAATPVKATPAVVPAKASPSAGPAKATPAVAPAKVTPAPAKATSSAAPVKPTPSAAPAKVTSPATPAKATPSAVPAKAAPKPTGSSGRQ